MKPSAEACVIVVTGLPRSGTSMAMRMLAAGGVPLLADGARPADADNPLGYFEYEPVKRTARDASWVREVRGKAVKVISELLPHLPGDAPYLVVWMQRALSEVYDSQERMLRRRGENSLGMDRASFERIFAARLSRTRAWLASRANLRVLELEYARAIEDPAGAAAALNAFLGGELDESEMRAAVAPTLHRQRR